MTAADTYTGLSFYVGSLALLVAVAFRLLNVYPRTRATLSVAAISNAIAVGLIGPFVVAWGKIHASAEQLHLSNAYLHALPSFVGLIFLLTWPWLVRGMPCLISACSILLANLILYLAVPHSHNNAQGLAKVMTSYGVRCPARWIAATAGVAICTASLICTQHG